MTASNRWLVVVGVAVAVIAVVSTIVAIAVDREVDLDPSTPEGMVQAYLRAVAEGDSGAAYSFYSDDLQARCDRRQVTDSLRYGPGDFSATLRGVTPRADYTEVRIDIIQRYGSDPFGSGESTFEHTFIVAEMAGGWRFDEPPWPSWCPAAPIATATAVPAPVSAAWR